MLTEFVALLSLTLVAASPFSLERRDGLAPLLEARGDDSVPGRYIVVYNDNVSGSSIASSSAIASKINITYNSAVKGFAGTFSEGDVKFLRQSQDVKYVEQVQKFTISAVQNDAQYGLVFISQYQRQQNPIPAGQAKYYYRATSLNYTQGHVYVVDTGIRTNASEFLGRALKGPNFVSQYEDNDDRNGHGTHVAGTVAARTFGVNKSAFVTSIKVFIGFGFTSNDIIIQAIDWIVANGIKKSVINFSGGGPFSQAVNDAFAKARSAGFYPVVAAGNENQDACNRSPASAPSIITVAAVDQNTALASFSNWGRCVDYAAAGVDIPSVDYQSNANTKVLSGTSMASPHVAGLLSYFLNVFPTDDPLALLSQWKNPVIVGDLKGSPNAMIGNGFFRGGGGA